MVSLREIYEGANIALCLILLTYASWSDWKNREVDNKVWILLAPPTFALTFIELFLFEPAQLTWFAACVGLTAAIATILFYSGGFGGADAKALMCLALALPFYPKNLLTPLLRTSPISRTFFPLTVFSNSVVLVVMPVAFLASRNLYWRWKTKRTLFEGNQQNESLGRKILVFITGSKIPISKLKEKWHIYPLEDIQEDKDGVKRKLIIMPKDAGRNEIVKRLETKIRDNTIPDDVWASPGLPMLILITSGLIIALFFGDIIWTLTSILLG